MESPTMYVLILIAALGQGATSQESGHFSDKKACIEAARDSQVEPAGTGLQVFYVCVRSPSER